MSVVVESPVGPWTLDGNAEALSAVHFGRLGEPGSLETASGELLKAGQQLERYFQSGDAHFDVKLAPAGTSFQRQVWDALLEIPSGETWSYGQLATRIGRPKAARAVGAANGRNPIPLFIPCHRVIGASGALTGYGAGGNRIKRFLLDLERQALSQAA